MENENWDLPFSFPLHLSYPVCIPKLSYSYILNQACHILTKLLFLSSTTPNSATLFSCLARLHTNPIFLPHLFCLLSRLHCVGSGSLACSFACLLASSCAYKISFVCVVSSVFPLHSNSITRRSARELREINASLCPISMPLDLSLCPTIRYLFPTTKTIDWTSLIPVHVELLLVDFMSISCSLKESDQMEQRERMRRCRRRQTFQCHKSNNLYYIPLWACRVRV